MNLNWDAIGAIGEIAGAVVVVITLIFLSKQIRETSSQPARKNEGTVVKSPTDARGIHWTSLRPRVKERSTHAAAPSSM
jgi:hypothetical protein